MSKRESKALEAHWSRALDVAFDAVEAGSAANTLPKSFCALELQHLRAERHWLANVRWPVARRA
jgi:hypothetical protein